MTSVGADRDVPNAPQDEPDPVEPSHPEPACQEAQKWIEAVTGRSFGDKDFRSGLENGILLCELLSAIKPGLVKKINRLPTPIAGLDNLSVFLKGCEELGLKGSQLFDPGDLQDTSVRANLKDSDCNRKLKNVLNTVFWLGKAANGSASYSGPTLNLKEFEGLLAQMRMECEEVGDSPQKRSVRDSGYDCWDSERSESLSPPQHTRDNSLDSLDSFGSRSQHSPSPDVVNRGNSDGRGSDSEADAPNRKPDVRRDDMLARRTASSESRHTVPFNQFLPNRANASAYVPTPRRKPRAEEGEHRSHPQAISEQGEGKRPGPRSKTAKTVTWAPEDSVNQEPTQEDGELTQEVLEQRKLQRLEKAGIKVLPAAVRYTSSRADTSEEQEVQSPSPAIILRRDNDFLTNQKAAWDSSSDGEGDGEAKRVPDVRRDDLASRRAPRGPTNPRVHQFVPTPVCSSKDRERWEGIRRASQQALQEKENRLAEEEDEEEEGQGGRVNAVPNKQKDDLARRRAQSRPLPHRDGPMSFISASMSQADMQKWERLRMAEPSEPSQAPVCQSCLEKNYGSPLIGSTKAGRGHSKVVTFGGVTEIEQPINTVTSREGEESDLLKRLLAKATVAMPTIGLGSQLTEREHSQVDGVDLTQAPPPTADLPPLTPEAPPTPAEMDARIAQYEGRAEEDDEEEDERIPDLRKDDMMARRTRAFHKPSAVITTYNRFLPQPGSKRCTQEDVATDTAPRNKREVQADRNKNLNVREIICLNKRGFSPRAEKQQASVAAETPRPTPDTTVIRPAAHSKHDYDDDEDDEYDENGPVPDLEKDDMMARRTGASKKPAAAGANHSIGTGASDAEAPPSKAPTRTCAGVREREERVEDEEKQEGDKAPPNTSAPPEPVSVRSLAPPPSPPAAPPPRADTEEEEEEEQSAEEGPEDGVERGVEGRSGVEGERPPRRPLWQEEDDLPPMMMSRRVAFMSEDTESVSMGDMLSEEEAGHIQPLNQSRFERMHEQFNNNQDEDDQWQDDLARWKNRRRSASQELIKKEEERKRMEKRMKEEGGDGNKRKSIKTYKEIVEEKERREADLCQAYRTAETPEEAAMVLQRYALRFTISDATLDSLKLPRSTSQSEPDPTQLDQERGSAEHASESETSDLHKTEPTATIDQNHKPEEMDTSEQGEKSAAISSRPPAPNDPPAPNEPEEPRPQQTEPAVTNTPPVVKDTPPRTKQTPPQTAVAQPRPAQPPHARSSPLTPPSRPVPLLTAKPYCQPKSKQSGHKPVKVDRLPRANGDATEERTSATSASSPPLRSPEGSEGAPPEQAVASQKTAEQSPLQEKEKAATPSGSAMSSLIGGRNCVVTTTIVTELTQTRVEPHPSDTPNDGQVNGTVGLLGSSPEEKEAVPATPPNNVPAYSPVMAEGHEDSNVTIETPMLNLAKRVNHWVWDPNEERKRQERWQQEQERHLQEQYQREQEKLKEEWERAQREVEEEERRHNEEERRILEETATPLNPSGLTRQQPGQTEESSPAQQNQQTEVRNVPIQHNGQTFSTGNEDQHASKLHFFQDSSYSESSEKQEMWKTSSLDRNSQLSQSNIVKRSGSHDTVIGTQQSPSSPSPQPPSPSRCVSGKRLCSGCSQPLGKGAAMIIDTLGLFFHIQCFKCGVCGGQLGDTSAGTDVRIRSGLLSCHECYISSRGAGQPTTL
ncbi:uncharacterized protein ACJ7VT_018055 [Polymixia lowei]